jgi:hypothetical protein
VRGAIARWFWGQPDLGQQLTKLHVPIAADICQAGADLLFAEPATFTVKQDTATQDRLLELTDDTFHGVVAEGAEIGGALGGHYLRVSWDKSIVPDKPFLTCVHADAAWPEFAYGRLRAVTFWTRLPPDGSSTPCGGTSSGTSSTRPATASSSTACTRAPRTTSARRAAHRAPGDGAARPGRHRRQRHQHPVPRPRRRVLPEPAAAAEVAQRPRRRRNLGRSDLDGVEHLMDALDETYSSWMRDIRLGKGRVFVARSLLENNDPGKGAAFDLDQEVFAPLNMLQDPTARQRPADPGRAVRDPLPGAQATATSCSRRSCAPPATRRRRSGWTTGGKASNMTATEVQAHERRSYLTRDRKIRLYKPRLQRSRRSCSPSTPPCSAAR